MLFYRFATRYDCGSQWVKDSIIDFAKDKLLSGQVFAGTLKPAETLACLAIRLGLDFRFTPGVEREVECTQVERHMRLCLVATPGFNDMVTISPSEPLLAEAAFRTMTENLDMDQVPRGLLDHIDSSYLDPGNRGEVIAALLLLLARDKAINDPDRKKPFPLDNDGATHGRIITVSEFLDALLPTDHHQSV
jgi:hypothetical protein